MFSLPDQTFSVIWSGEKWWIAHQPWLKSRGYVLRARYNPGWEPSWHAEGVHEFDAEDRMPIRHPSLLDATRTSDGRFVMLKRVDATRHPHEVELTTKLCSAPLSSDPRNHCVRVFEVLQDPEDANIQILVLPLLRDYANPRFDTVGEAVDCFRQVIQCLLFLHENKVAHRDIHGLNIMMDGSPLHTIPFHPADHDFRLDFQGRWRALYTRTERPVTYHIIDFGLSTQYDTVDPPPLDLPILPGDKTVPEFVGDDPANPFSGLLKLHNPFPTDVYCLGNWIREDFLDGLREPKSNIVFRSARLGLEFMRPLVNEMTQKDPSKRPSMGQVAERFEAIAASLSSWKLRSRVAKEHDHPLYSIYLSATHWLRRVRLIATRRPAVPFHSG